MQLTKYGNPGKTPGQIAQDISRRQWAFTYAVTGIGECLRDLAFYK